MMKHNGVLIQYIDEPTNYVTEFKYFGINAFQINPLVAINDDESKRLTREQQNIRIIDNRIVCSDLITDIDLLTEYVRKCEKLNLRIRLLFINSLYSSEEWFAELPQMTFIGYEYCPFPIDEQIVTDLNWFKPLFKFHNKLNEYGLFKSLDSINSFIKEYNKFYLSGVIGDGDIESYVCEVYLIEDVKQFERSQGT